MKLKKYNAVLSILSTLTLLIHVGYNVFAYVFFFYHPMAKTLTTLPFLLIVCGHAICGMCSVFLLEDGTHPAMYPRQNAGTIIQRVSAALIFPLLIIHMYSYSLLAQSANGKMWLFITVIVLQILFFAVIASHVAVSFSKAFITLGLLSDVHKKKVVDTLIIYACAILFVLSSFCVVRGEIVMFLVL